MRSLQPLAAALTQDCLLLMGDDYVCGVTVNHSNPLRLSSHKICWQGEYHLLSCFPHYAVIMLFKTILLTWLKRPDSVLCI